MWRTIRASADVGDIKEKRIYAITSLEERLTLGIGGIRNKVARVSAVNTRRDDGLVYETTHNKGTAQEQ